MSQTQLQRTESKEQPQSREPEQQQPAPAAEQALEARIRIRAYQLFEMREGAPGDPEDDWYRAEAEIIGKPGETDH